LHPSDGNRLHLGDGIEIKLRLRETTYHLAVHFDSSTPPGTAGLSLVYEAVWTRLPIWVDLIESITTERRVA
jgi:hypothetical protein